REKVELIKAYGGEVQNPGPDGDIEKTAARLAEESPTGHFMDQFTYAERAYDYRDDHNVAATIFRQIAEERHPDPKWIVVGAGTGGTSATIGRHIRFSRRDTRVCVVDPQNSAFFPNWTANLGRPKSRWPKDPSAWTRSEEHTSELQSRENLVCRLLLEKKKQKTPPVTAEQASRNPAAYAAP